MYSIVYAEEIDEFLVYDGEDIANVFKEYEDALTWVQIMEE